MDRLGLLESFVIALDEGSLNRAAQRRGISQPAMSLQIKQLEALLGHELLHRSSTGVKPTRAGQLVYSQAQGLLSGYDRMSAELSALEENVSGTFRISTSTFFWPHYPRPSAARGQPGLCRSGYRDEARR